MGIMETPEPRNPRTPEHPSRDLHDPARNEGLTCLLCGGYSAAFGARTPFLGTSSSSYSDGHCIPAEDGDGVPKTHRVEPLALTTPAIIEVTGYLYRQAKPPIEKALCKCC